MLSQHTLCICKDKYLILTVHFHKGKKVETPDPVVELLLAGLVLVVATFGQSDPYSRNLPDTVQQDET